MSTTPIILCSPRTASRFFAAEFQKQSGIDITKTHDGQFTFSPLHIIIGIVRDPKEVISSDIAMGHCLHNTPIDHDINVQSFIDRYIKTNTVIAEKANVIVSYESIILDIADTVKRVLEHTNVLQPEFPNYEPSRLIEDRLTSTDGYLVSSKTYQHYDEIYNKVSGYDLSKAYDAYNLAKARSIC
jgi:hypothetical protein